ncbi:MAG: nuclear transport factor 2 family protein [Cyanobacteria bacterium J06626_18]
MIKSMKPSVLAIAFLISSFWVGRSPMPVQAQTAESNHPVPATEASTLETFTSIEEEWLNAVQFETESELQSRLVQLIADDFVYQYGSGQNLTKESFIDLLTTGGITVTKRGPLDLSVRDYGDTVITYGSSAMAGEEFGQSYDGNLRFVNVWQRQPNGDWTLTHRNSELIQ